MPRFPRSAARERPSSPEDDEQVRETVVAMLSDLAYMVLKSSDASAALNILESGVPFDLLFTDVVMLGVLKSSDMARQARERLPGLAVLFTSGYAENSIVHGGRLDPGVELLSKPYTPEALARKIRHVLNNRKQAALAAERPKERSESTRDRVVASRRRVLLVEDNDLIRMGERRHAGGA